MTPAQAAALAETKLGLEAGPVSRDARTLSGCSLGPALPWSLEASERPGHRAAALLLSHRALWAAAS